MGVEWLSRPEKVISLLSDAFSIQRYVIHVCPR